GALVNKPQAFPEKCLVRFIDPTVAPGLAYEYRIQIKMANPTHGQEARAVSKQMTKEKDILGPWQPITWKEGDKIVSQVAVSDELLFYVVNEDKPAGAPATGNPARTAPQNEDKLAVQIHRWLGEIRSKPGQQSNTIDVGDWSILERRLVHRGEYLGKIEEVEIPVWNTPFNRPGFAIHPEEKIQRQGQAKIRTIRHKGAPVDFSADPVQDGKALLIDFEGVDRVVGGGSRPPKHTGPVEALIMTADGRLLVRNSIDDANSQERKDRVKAWADWLNYVRNLGDSDGKKNDLFDKGGGKGPGGSGS
ncbi:MAG TPA: hypothetical protein VGY77_01785, partial [Gemmataceae bacterium]|nr:hypothetical protein [Gemmataceae bacterium]